jgi:hypothetical protein
VYRPPNLNTGTQIAARALKNNHSICAAKREVRKLPVVTEGKITNDENNIRSTIGRIGFAEFSGPNRK